MADPDKYRLVDDPDSFKIQLPQKSIIMHLQGFGDKKNRGSLLAIIECLLYLSRLSSYIQSDVICPFTT